MSHVPLGFSGLSKPLAIKRCFYCRAKLGIVWDLWDLVNCLQHSDVINIMEYQLSIRRVFRLLIHHLMDQLLLICLFVCFCFVTGHAPCLPCLRGRSCTTDTPWQTHSSFKAKVKADIISPLFTISTESHPSFNQQFSSLCYSELLDNILTQSTVSCCL